MNGSIRYLALAKKAGKLQIGEDSVQAAAEMTHVRLIVTASDAGASALRKAQFCAQQYNLPCVGLQETKAELGNLVGRGTPGILAFTDTGLASAFLTELDREIPGCCTEEAALLQKRAVRQAERRSAAGKARKAKSVPSGEKGRK